MEFSNYEQLITYLKALPTQQEQLQGIVQYFLNNVEFDYVMIEHLNQIVTPKFANYVDKLFPNINDKLRDKAINIMRNSSNISNQYWDRIKTLYLKEIHDKNGNARHLTMLEALNSISVDYIEENGLLKKGVANHIITFAKKLCDEIGINALIVNGISSGKMQHYWLDICLENNELFYDIAFALYVRDNFCGMGKRYKIEEWLGITPKQLYKNQPTRTIQHPQGYNLEYLGLHNLPLCMRDFFDTSA